MIDSNYKLKIKKELKRYDTSLKAFILGYDTWFIGVYLRTMRISIYCEKHPQISNRIIGAINKMINRHVGRIIGFQFHSPNIGWGIKVFHWGSIVINRNAHIGNKLCIYPGVCIGKTADGGVPIIGDNVTFFTNSGAYGNIRIGNNVTIVANAVVTHDIPDNCIVGGIPAKIIKYKK